MHEDFHLAHCNISTMRGAYDDAVMAGFVARLDDLNALAERSPGFVWRLESETEEAIAVQAFGNPKLLFNLSVWESLEALDHYVYRTAHAEALRLRRDWFEPPTRASFALWWVPAGHIPDALEAKTRFETLWAEGPSPTAFSFRRRFDPAGAAL